MPDATWHVVLNPASGGARRRSSKARLERALDAAGVAWQLEVTSRRGDAEHLIADAAGHGARQFAVAGGDGTAHEALNGLCAQPVAPLAEFTLAMLPLGTGNDWARSLRVPRNLASAARLLATGSRVAHDVGVLTYRHEGRARTRYFLNAAGAGFDAHVVRLVQGRGAGRWTYVAGLVRGAFSFRAPVFGIRAGHVERSAPTLVVFAHIGRYLGGGMRIARGAHYDDGLFDVTIVREMPAAAIIAQLPRLLFGDLARSRWVTTTRVADMAVQGDADIEADGELLGRLPARLHVLPAALNVIAGGRLSRYE